MERSLSSNLVTSISKSTSKSALEAIERTTSDPAVARIVSASSLSEYLACQGARELPTKVDGEKELAHVGSQSSITRKYSENTLGKETLLELVAQQQRDSTTGAATATIMQHTSMGPPATSSASPRDGPPAAKHQKVETGAVEKYGQGEYEAGKAAEEFRNYKDSARQAIVENHYRLMRTHQTLDFVKRMEKKYKTFDHAKLEIWQAFQALETYVDSSDPDAEFPNIEHAFQTAEGIRAAGHPDWFQLIGLIHDIGKLQFLWGGKEDGQEGTAHGDQWALGGDTWVVGCKIPSSCVFPEFNFLNPDMQDPRYNTETGIYERGCGINSLHFAWGHDEYAYLVVKNHTDKLRTAGHANLIPDEGLAMLRFHSAYPWHNKGEYAWAEAPGDEKLKEAVLKFNTFDLYTKADVRPDIQALWPYYQELVDKYLPGKLAW